MKNVKCIILLIGTALLSTTVWAQSSSKHEVLFQKAIYTMETMGDMKGAIELFNELIKKYPGERACAAKAQLHIGLCYEKLGKTEAVKAYESVLSQFAEQADVVAQAKDRLAVLRKEEPAGLTMTRLLPAEVNMMDVTLSPDGTKAAGTVVDMPEAEGMNMAVYDLTTGKMKLITDYTYNPDSREAYIPIWSPDSREIAFQANVLKSSIEEIWISNLAGKPRLLLTNPNGGLIPCDWLPDGSAVVTILEKENNAASLGLVSVKDGSVREICPLLRAYDEYYVVADASPDGRFIVFADGPQDGQWDIFVISMDGRSKAPLVDHPGDDRQPRWSPDGRHIAYLSDRNGKQALWGVAVREGKPDGPPFMILEGMQDSDLSTWTKKGLLYLTEMRINEVYIQEIDPQSYVALGKPRVVDHSPGEAFVGPHWSPDGKHLRFRSYKDGKSELMVMPSEGGKPRSYKMSHRTAQIKGGYGTWLPDGSSMGEILWDIDKRLYFSRLDLDAGEWNTRLIPSAEVSSGFNWIVWSHDGKSFFAFKKGEDGAEPGMVEHDLETGRERYLFRAQPGEDYGFTLKISRDYRRLALDEGGIIVLVDTETGQVERLEFGEKKHLFHPSWSPDGKHLVAKGEPEGGGDFSELYIVFLPDGKFKSLDINRYLPSRMSRILTSPDWSPDGRMIAFDLWTFRPEANLISNVVPVK